MNLVCLPQGMLIGNEGEIHGAVEAGRGREVTTGA
jgi:hypothetical protein